MHVSGMHLCLASKKHMFAHNTCNFPSCILNDIPELTATFKQAHSTFYNLYNIHSILSTPSPVQWAKQGWIISDNSRSQKTG